MFLLQLMEMNEELLLHVFGNQVPLGYQLGLYKVPCSGQPTLKLAMMQSEHVLKVWSP